MSICAECHQSIPERNRVTTEGKCIICGYVLLGVSEDSTGRKIIPPCTHCENRKRMAIQTAQTVVIV